MVSTLASREEDSAPRNRRSGLWPNVRSSASPGRPHGEPGRIAPSAPFRHSAIHLSAETGRRLTDEATHPAYLNPRGASVSRDSKGIRGTCSRRGARDDDGRPRRGEDRVRRAQERRRKRPRFRLRREQAVPEPGTSAPERRRGRSPGNGSHGRPGWSPPLGRRARG